MNGAIDKDLRQLLNERRRDFLEGWRARLGVAMDPRAVTPEPELDAEMRGVLAGLAGLLETSSGQAEVEGEQSLRRVLCTASQTRAMRGFTPEETLQYIQACKDTWLGLWHEEAVDPQRSREGDQRILGLMDRSVLMLASSFVAAREEVIRRQGESLREVSTPVITLWDSMLLLPLVGIVDSVRAQQISERLLEAISRNEAEVTLIDVTGVPVMDTSVARHILKTVNAAEILGTRVILTGIGPSTAQTMVKLGIDMTGVPTRASLKSGLALALSMTRRGIVEHGEA